MLLYMSFDKFFFGCWVMWIKCISLISDWCAKIYQHGWWNGWEKVIQETSMLDLTGNENNEASSVRVHPGCNLNFFSEHNNVGPLGSTTNDVIHLSTHFADQVSSLSCTCQGMITTHFWIWNSESTYLF